VRELKDESRYLELELELELVHKLIESAMVSFVHWHSGNRVLMKVDHGSGIILTGFLSSLNRRPHELA
jgi:hypothetical protein